MDKLDLLILQALQKDCSPAISELASLVSLGTTACWRRIQRLEESGHIRSRVAVLNRKKLKVNLTVFVAVSTGRHTPEWLKDFHELVSTIPEIVECYRIAGDTDYMMKVVIPDVEAYDGVYKRLIEIPGLEDISSTFAMEEVKYTTAIPLYYAEFE